jgi:hypothetical protein
MIFVWISADAGLWAPLQRCFESAAGLFGPVVWLGGDAEQPIDEAGLRPPPPASSQRSNWRLAPVAIVDF